MSLFDPKVQRHLIADHGEVVIDEVEKHWTAMVKPFLELLLVIPILLLILVLPKQLYFLPLLAAPIVLVHALWRILGVRMDRFVITNMRVFRVHGILTQHIATMPISRILDISVKKPLIGRLLGYGHFIFESAAQDQGLREILYVGDPDERGLTIQRVIQQAGLRGPAGQPHRDRDRVREWEREQARDDRDHHSADQRSADQRRADRAMAMPIEAVVPGASDDDDGTGTNETRSFDRIIGDPTRVDVVERDSWTQPIPTQDGR